MYSTWGPYHLEKRLPVVLEMKCHLWEHGRGCVGKKCGWDMMDTGGWLIGIVGGEVVWSACVVAVMGS